MERTQKNISVDLVIQVCALTVSSSLFVVLERNLKKCSSESHELTT